MQICKQLLTQSIKLGRYKYYSPEESSHKTYEQEVQIILNNFFDKFRKVDENEQMDLTVKTFNNLSGAKFGIVSNANQFTYFLQIVNSILEREMLKLNRTMHSQQIEHNLKHIKSIYDQAFEFQLVKWKAVPLLVDWLQLPTTQNLFVETKQPLMMMKYFNLLHQNGLNIDPFEKNIQNLVSFFTHNKLSLKDKIHYFYAMMALRPYTNENRLELKQSLKEFSKLRDKVLTMDRKFLSMGGEYLNVAVWVYYQSIMESTLPLLSASDIEQENHQDPEVDSYLAQIFEILLNQDVSVYNKVLLNFRTVDFGTVDSIGLIDPIQWRTLSNMSSAVFLLASQNRLQDTWFSRYEQSVSRKLETDMAHLRYGTNICNTFLKFESSEKNLQSMLITSLCDQIASQPFNELAISHENLTKILYTLVLVQTKLTHSDSIIYPAIRIVCKNINEGYFDKGMRKVDWYDLKQIADELKLKDIQNHINKMIEI